jgi:hypothetical protein
LRERVKVAVVDGVPEEKAADCWKVAAPPDPPPVEPEADVKVATTAYQSVAAPSVAVPSWTPAVADTMSCS